MLFSNFVGGKFMHLNITKNSRAYQLHSLYGGGAPVALFRVTTTTRASSSTFSPSTVIKCLNKQNNKCLSVKNIFRKNEKTKCWNETIKILRGTIHGRWKAGKGSSHGCCVLRVAHQG